MYYIGQAYCLESRVDYEWSSCQLYCYESAAAVGPGAARRGARVARTVRATAAVGPGEGKGELPTMSYPNIKRQRKWEKTQTNADSICVLFCHVLCCILLPNILNDLTVDTHILVVGFRWNGGKMTGSEKGICFSKISAQTRRLMCWKRHYLLFKV